MLDINNLLTTRMHYIYMMATTFRYCNRMDSLLDSSTSGYNCSAHPTLSEHQHRGFSNI